MDGTATLEISSASKTDAGDYLCKATNDTGSEFCKSRVTIKEKGRGAPAATEAAPAAAKPAKKLDNLFFIEEPKSVQVSEKSTATFIAKVGGDPIPNVKWMKGKWRQMTHGGRISIEQKGQDAKLEIRDVTKTDSGQYRCIASNKHGEIECSTDLNVSEKKEVAALEGDLRAKLKKTPSKQKSPEQEQEINIVELLRNVDPKEYEKYARMYGITDFRGLLQAIEFLKKEKADETGRPELGEHGRRESDEDLDKLVSDLQKRMEQTEPITLVKDIRDQTTVRNEEAVFECEIKINYPEISLSWYKGTQKLDDNDKYEIRIVGDRHLLKIKRCQPGDQGNYRVVCGPHISSAKLAVVEREVEESLKPAAPRMPVDETVSRTTTGMREEVPTEVPDAYKKPEREPIPSAEVPDSTKVPGARKPVEEMITPASVPEGKDRLFPKEYEEAKKLVPQPAPPPAAPTKDQVTPKKDIPEHIVEVAPPKPHITPGLKEVPAKVEPEPEPATRKKAGALPPKVPEEPKKPVPPKAELPKKVEPIPAAPKEAVPEKVPEEPKKPVPPKAELPKKVEPIPAAPKEAVPEKVPEEPKKPVPPKAELPKKVEQIPAAPKEAVPEKVPDETKKPVPPKAELPKKVAPKEDVQEKVPEERKKPVPPKAELPKKVEPIPAAPKEVVQEKGRELNFSLEALLPSLMANYHTCGH
ncbi:titin-like [Anguilla rostrata]|uniref:titin-like n=1 Tax=Anguilla rostrata TaxID=7938 RepID=UPI0030CEFE71